MTVGLSSEVTFASGDDALSDGARAALGRVAAILAKLPNAVRIEGHTDAVPVRGGRFSSNWHLSAARAQRVVRLLMSSGARSAPAPGGRLRRRPPARPNATPEGRAGNRRIEIKILKTGKNG